ncbi:TonB-dependent receptor [Eilatimonas milleporae]|uniref:Outer membrane receptor protein involved in Fe transport n=1 Tax=Eilatimonas milleporae TaxID=911205 RepID=A0A3M0CTY2_9PROT|nr:TonB-dependent receptor [Eilatimonas milleporae]RMB12435.1 outer membrane receptor protein involved in Fe transport [Eilatimonas milleporae]
MIPKNMATSAIALWAVLMPEAARGQQGDDTETTDLSMEEIIITGVFRDSSLSTAPVAVTAIEDEVIQQSGVISAADLLKNVPGVFVNSSLGEIRNTVYSRGVAAGSNEAASGYFYVSMQEDGLPVTNVTFSNYGPDYFLRSDATLGRLEALRGGTAVIAGPNAPGGIFNYISKTGKSDPGALVTARFGLEGDGRNPYYRMDAFIGGEVSGADGLYYSVGGFYRSSDGARDPGYTANEGGQLKANLLWEYDTGSVKLGAKYLNDSNVFFEFLPARGYDDPDFAPGITPYDSTLPPAAPHTWTDAFGEEASWDGSNLVKNEQFAVTLNWNHDFDNGWSVQNDFRYSMNNTDWNTGAVIFPVPATDTVAYVFANTLGRPGVYRFTDRATGAVAAEVTSATGFDHTLTLNNLPNPGIIDGGLLTQVAFDPDHEVDEIMNQFKVTKEFDNQLITIGAFFSRAEIFRSFSGGGIGFSGIEDNPSLYDVDLIAPDGTVFQVTSPEGFAAVGDALSAGNVNDGTQEQISIFLAHNIDLTDKLTLDWGVRYETLDYNFTNSIASAVPVPEVFSAPDAVGEDGDPLTLFDNYLPTLGTPLNADRDYDYLSYSVALVYEMSDEVTTYLRFSSGEKAPDANFVVGIDTEDEARNLFQDAQEIRQFEIGIRYTGDDLSLSLFPFWSELSNVGDNQLFSDENGETYTPPPALGMTTTYGVEAEMLWTLSPALSLRANATIQQADSEDFGAWVANGPERGDDELVLIPDGDADNIPNFMGRATLTYAPVEEFTSYATWTYLGDRPANRNNAFDLPAFSIFDLGANYQLFENVLLGAEVRNVFNKTNGVMSWGPTGGLLASLNRQALTRAQVDADPNGLLNIITAPPRSFFFTASVNF